ncbi:aminotransferase class I/II-fold pyridoxal phosphate-dependent enzyme [Roseococcus sp. YIM B11640]|uniref:aminotransferase class I/II-fold pyridoxal phosphate-dependent enzyme n=1 Tax=Roseococcus sp. YIM B11640 TaxID=3133973 RepID=UPI003C7E1C49
MTGNRGLSEADRAALLKRLAGRSTTAAPEVAPSTARDFSTLPAAREVAATRALGRQVGLSNPYFRPHEGIAGARTVIGNAEYVNFSSYNYLGLNGDPRVAEAARQAIARHGVSASASRFVSGERPVHGALEAALAANYGAEDAVVMVSGHATNVSVIGHLLGPEDLVVHDALVHNSATEGVRLSRARRLAFPNNDWEAAAALLAAERPRHGRALVLIEGHYSMDGTVPELARFAEIARRHDAWLMVDEAHSLGVLGPTGRGVFESQGVAPGLVDIWMGTLSKTLSACGGYIAGSRTLVDLLRHTAPGFVYSVGMAPPLAAAAECALRLMQAEPWRVARLHANARRFRDKARAAGFDTGGSVGQAIVPVILGESVATARAAERLFELGVNVQPIVFPVVPEGQARLRFFLSCEHSEEDIDNTIRTLSRVAREAA